MKFKIKTEVIKRGLDIVNHATASITTTPILENILIKVAFNNIVLTSNNLEMAIEYVIDKDIEIETEGSFCVPSKLFTNYISLVNDDDITIELLGDDSIEIKTQSGKVKIKGLDAKEFPLIPKINEEKKLILGGKTIKNSIDKTLFSSAEGNIRPTLAGIYINVDKDNIIFASTDSFRLSEYISKIESPVDNNFDFILPSKTASQIKSILGEKDDVKLVFGENQIIFIFDNTKVFSRLLNGKFPDYSNFFPKSYSTKSEINRVDLMGALRKINLISKENNYSIKMGFSAENGIMLDTSETQIGEGSVNLVGTIEGEDNVIGINSTYFLEVLGVMNSTHISISFESALSPVMINQVNDPDKKNIDATGFKHIIMPLKI